MGSGLGIQFGAITTNAVVNILDVLLVHRSTIGNAASLSM